MHAANLESDSIPIQAIIARAVGGDAPSVQYLVDNFADIIAREIRTQRRFHSLQARVDSDDIVQSVWRCFFGAVVGGEIEFQHKNDLVAYLKRLSQNKIQSEFRKHLAIKRDIRKTEGDIDVNLQDNSNESPSQNLSTFELLLHVLAQMTDEERLIAERRAQGVSWEELAVELSSTADAVRKRHARMRERIRE